MKQRIFIIILALVGAALHLTAQVWQQQDPQIPGPARVWLLQVPNETAAWVSGNEQDTFGFWTEENYIISRTTDGGQTWENLSFPHTEPGYLSNICALNENVAWISYVDYANGNKILKTIDGGQTWTDQPIGMAVWINFVHFFDNGVGLAMGDPDDQGFEIYVSQNGGNFWERVDTADVPPALPGEYGYSNYFEVSGSKVWFETSGERIYFSPNKGNTWQVFEGPLAGASYNMFAADDAGMCYMSYTEFDTNFLNPMIALYRTPDNGANWEDITPTDNTWNIWDIEPVPGADAIIASFNKGIISGIYETRISYDQGTTWLTIDAGTPVNFLAFSDDETGFGTGWQPLTDSSHPDVYSYSGSSLVGLFDRKPLNVNLSVSPNPTVDFVRLELEAAQPDNFLLLLNDASGRLLQKQVFEKTDRWNTLLDLRTLPLGVYTVTVSTKEGVTVQKVMKQ